MVKQFFFTLTSCLFVIVSVAQPVKYSNEFLSIGVGARQLGMAGAVQATTSDVFSTYWNPCGILEINQAQAGLMHNENFGGITKYDYLGFAHNSQGNHAIGVSLVRNGVDGIPNTLDLIDENGNIRDDRVTKFSVADYAFFISYAKKTRVQGLSFGANAKIIRRIVGQFASAWGCGIDISARYSRKRFQLGATLRDATTTYNAWKFNTERFSSTFQKTGNIIPQNSVEITMPRLNTGLAYSLPLGSKCIILAEIDLEITTDGKRNVVVRTNVASIDPRVGLEFSFRNMLFARCGVNNMQRIPDANNTKRTDIQPNIGAGFKFKNLAVDYALAVMGDNTHTLYSNIFSLSYSFEKKD